MSDTVATLDLRAMLPFSQRERVFHAWMHLAPGETLRIFNDRDPRPLRDRFQAKCKNRFRWAYEEKGPEEWIVRIVKR